MKSARSSTRTQHYKTVPTRREDKRQKKPETDSPCLAPTPFSKAKLRIVPKTMPIRPGMLSLCCPACRTILEAATPEWGGDCDECVKEATERMQDDAEGVDPATGKGTAHMGMRLCARHAFRTGSCLCCAKGITQQRQQECAFRRSEESLKRQLMLPKRLRRRR